MPWWGYIIIVSVIFLCVTGILIWIIAASNKIVILKKKVDRNFPVMNYKIKDYLIQNDKLLAYYSRKIKKHARPFENFKKGCDELKDAEGIFAKVEKFHDVKAKYELFVKNIKKQEVFKGSKKLDEYLLGIEKVQNEIILTIQKYNDAVSVYNKTISVFPEKIIAERFKFNEMKYFETK